MTEPVLLRRMVDDLVASGELVPQWREIFASVPRSQAVLQCAGEEPAGGRQIPFL